MHKQSKIRNEYTGVSCPAIIHVTYSKIYLHNSYIYSVIVSYRTCIQNINEAQIFDTYKGHFVYKVELKNFPSERNSNCLNVSGSQNLV